MNQQQFDRWTYVREKGKDNFVWMSGVAGWGFSTGLLYAVVTHLLDNQWDAEALLSMEFLTHLGFSLLFFAVAGFVWGRAIWSLTDKKYEAAKKKK